MGGLGQGSWGDKMGLSLFVGRLPGYARGDVSAYLGKASDAAPTSVARVELFGVWDAAPEEVGYFDALNEASTVAFLDHAARLEGLKDSNEALTHSRWRHLPYWVESYWLPVRSEATTGGPVFCGSAHGLLANLADIRSASPYGLGVIPPHFELMRADPRAFYALRLDAFDNVTTLQWLFRSYFEAATLAVERNLPMWSSG
jgi:hypothetical protein